MAEDAAETPVIENLPTIAYLCTSTYLRRSATDLFNVKKYFASSFRRRNADEPELANRVEALYSPREAVALRERSRRHHVVVAFAGQREHASHAFS
jgi:hypothetical protein